METSKQRVLKAINHIEPETTPVHIIGFESGRKYLEYFKAEDQFELRQKLSLDLALPFTVYTGPNTKRGQNIWGNATVVGGARGAGYGRAVYHPLADVTSVQDIERFAWPDPNDFDYESAGKILRTTPDSACCVMNAHSHQGEGVTNEDAARGRKPKLTMVHGTWLPILCTLFELFGLEETLIMLKTEPKIIEATIARVEAFMLELGRRQLEATRGLVDIYITGDDFATQQGMMISPELWRRFLKPTYKKIFELIKSYGVKVWFHSCGTFRPVLPDLIDIGMDVWETVQAHLPGNEPEVLKREYGRDICFFGAINSQSTLPLGTTEDVRAEVRERIQVLGKGGGYICGPDHTVLRDVPLENVLAMLDEAKKFGTQ